MDIRFFDLFAGIGGFRLGLEKASTRNSTDNKSGTSQHSKCAFRCVGACEYDKAARIAYGNNFGNEPEYGDITTVDINELPDFDLLTFGWPCQDNSIAGKRKGQKEGTRSGLLSYAVEILRIKKPRYFIAENVRGLYSVNAGIDFIETLRMLTHVGNSSPQYTLQSQLLNTRWFLPQNRERIYFVGLPRGKCGAEILPIEAADGTTDEWDTEVQITNTLQSPGHASGNYRGMNMIVIPVLTPGRKEKRQNGRRFKDVGGDMFTLTGIDQHGVLIELTEKQRQGYRVYSTEGIASTIAGSAGGVGAKTGLYMDICNAITTDGYLVRGERNRDINGKTVLTSMCERRIRRLTPTECLRLQGFPDDWLDGLSDTQKYKCAGNAVSIPVVEEIGGRLARHIDKTGS